MFTRYTRNIVAVVTLFALEVSQFAESELHRPDSEDVHWISLSTWDLGLEEICAISDFAL